MDVSYLLGVVMPVLHAQVRAWQHNLWPEFHVRSIQYENYTLVPVWLKMASHYGWG